jgi:hypothetical protein
VARSCVPPTCTSSSTAESTSRDGPSTGTVFTARDRHPAPESGGYRPIRGEADVEALAPWVRHVLTPSRAPALALSCHEADNLSEADRAPTNRIRSVSASRVRCSHLPRSALRSTSAAVPGAVRNIPHLTAAPAYGEHADIAGGHPPIAPVLCPHSVPHAMLPNNPLKRIKTHRLRRRAPTSRRAHRSVRPNHDTARGPGGPCSVAARPDGHQPGGAPPHASRSVRGTTRGISVPNSAPRVAGVLRPSPGSLAMAAPFDPAEPMQRRPVWGKERGANRASPHG